MYIHVGNKIIVSDKNIVGIFNSGTLTKSEWNNYLVEGMDDSVKSIIITAGNERITSIVSPYTIIKRTQMDRDLYWRNKNDG